MTENQKRRMEDRLPGHPLQWDEETANDEILALHRRLAAEKLRADRAEERADAKSKECIELRERMASVPPLTASAAPVQTAEPIGFISEDAKDMLLAGRSVTVSVTLKQWPAWPVPIYLAAPAIPAHAEQVEAARNRALAKEAAIQAPSHTDNNNED
jgi:hypothetical protein